MSHSHAHAHTHTPSVGENVLAVCGSRIFTFSPAVNALLAASAVTVVTQVLIACAPPLRGRALAFLVAFAGGSMLGTIFLHIIPEIEFSRECGVVLLAGFLSFVALEKALKMFAGSEHTHSHASAAPDEVEDVTGSQTSTLPERTKPVKRNRKSKTEKAELTKHVDSAVAGPQSFNILPWLNVVADSLHNLTDGISLAVSFRKSVEAGTLAFLMMCCHEIPHQFGDFALLINTGTSKSTARAAQLCTAAGTLAGCVLGSNLGTFNTGLEKALDQYAVPLAAGVFLYVSAVGVIPELLETRKGTTADKIADFAVMVLGLSSGVLLLLKLD